MSRIVPKNPVSLRALDESRTTAGELAAPGPHDLDIERPASEGGAFFRFQYTMTELSLHGGRAQVRGRRVELADGRLRTETFEGELAPQAFTQAVREAQERVLAHCAALMNPWSWLLPAARRPRDDGE
jgi:hypothetical protein